MSGTGTIGHVVNTTGGPSGPASDVADVVRCP